MLGGRAIPRRESEVIGVVLPNGQRYRVLGPGFGITRVELDRFCKFRPGRGHVPPVAARCGQVLPT